jgi:hypothetical protein
MLNTLPVQGTKTAAPLFRQTTTVAIKVEAVQKGGFLYVLSPGGSPRQNFADYSVVDSNLSFTKKRGNKITRSRPVMSRELTSSSCIRRRPRTPSSVSGWR